MISALPSETDSITKSIGNRVGEVGCAAYRVCALVLALACLPPTTLQGQAPQAAPAAANASQSPFHPLVRLPVVPLGYLPPGDMPEFDYFAMVELRFIDADHLMFAFNMPGLLKRNHNCQDSDVQRMVHAVVFQLPSGQVEKQAEWELYDFSDFLWGLGDGKLMLRRCNQLESVGADLDPQLLVRAMGTVEDITFSPDHSMLVVEESAPPSAEDKDSGAVASVLAQGTDARRTNVSFIQTHPLHMIGRAEIPVPSAIPVVANGLFEVLPAPNDQWDVKMQVFQKAERQIVTIQSLCPPAIQAISNTVFMATTCSKDDKESSQGYNLQGTLLWQIALTPDQSDQSLISFANGSRFAIESLRLKRPRAALDPLTKEDVIAQDIDIYDTVSGVRIATFQTSPAYTGGRNVDFSPDGTRMAVLNDGAIEIYSLSDLAKALQQTSH